MKCKELETNAIMYLGGKLPPAQRDALEGHLAVCPACRERVQGFAQVMGLLGEWQNVQPSPFFQTRLTARLKEEPVSQSWWASLWQERALPEPGRRGFRPAARPLFAVALAVVMTVALVVFRYLPAPLPVEPIGRANRPLGITDPSAVTVASTAGDDQPGYQDLPQDLPLLEDWEVLRNFEVLQELGNTNPVLPVLQ